MGNSASYSSDIHDNDDYSHESSYEDSEFYSDEESSFRSSQVDDEEEDEDDLVVVDAPTNDDADNAKEEENKAEEENVVDDTTQEESSSESLEEFWKDLLGWMESFVTKTELSINEYLTRELILEHVSDLPQVAFVLQQQTSGNQEFIMALEERYTPIAFKILDQCHDIRNVRFQLVPGKIKEHAFWATVFVLIWNRHKNDTHDEEQDVTQETKSQDNLSTHENERESPASTKVAALSSTYGSSFQQIMNGGHVSAMHVNDSLKRVIKEKTWQILQLEKELEQAKQTIRQLEQEQNKPKQMNGCADPEAPEQDDATVEARHAGTWVLTQDAQDFLALDDEIKQNLRLEKKKRLQDVRQQMKFILDSDHPRDAYGEWDCCHAKEYSSECTCAMEGDTKPQKGSMTRHASM